jgi:predicted nucleic acid-binding protein
VTVVDAGAVVVALLAEGELGERARSWLSAPCSAPELVDLEVGSALRRLVLAGRLSQHRARSALDDLHDLSITRAPHRPLLTRCWELRNAVTFYDATYVALAETLDGTLLTTDRPLTLAPGIRCRTELLTG